MDEIAVKVDLQDEILIDAEGLDAITIYVNNYVKELETLTNSLKEHKESTVNPHSTNITQEFADAKITALQPEITGGEIPDADYNAFKAFFAGLVDKSVKSFIRGLVSWVKSLADRIGVLEDNVVLDITTTEVITSLTITQDKNGKPLNLVDFDIIVSGENVSTFNNAYLTFGNTNNIYWNGVTGLVDNCFVVYLRGYIDKRFEGILMLRKIVNNYVFHQLTNDTSIGNTIRSTNYGGYITDDIGNITSISMTNLDWKAGAKIKIVKR
jgi:hypothetical protein